MTTLLRFLPIPLADAPEVEALLVRLGLGPFDPATLSALPGRNDTWAGTTASGTAVFVKRLTGPAEDVRRRMDRALAFEALTATGPERAMRGPRLLGSDEEGGLLAFEYLEGARNGTELMLDQTFGPDLAAQAGKALGLLHATALPCGTGGGNGRDGQAVRALDTSTPPLPSLGLLEALPLPMYEEASSAELQTWQLLQNDASLIAAVTALLEAERTAPKVPAHCDLRMDQFLVTTGTTAETGTKTDTTADPGRPRLLVADWEEFRAGDAARDIGGFVGEWLHRSVLDIVMHRGGSAQQDADPLSGAEAFSQAGMSRKTVLHRGRSNLLRVRPVIEAFWAGYRQARPRVDPGLAHRATGFAGWHLLDRLLAGAARANHLRAIERAAAGIGRTALIAPARFTTTLGLGETS
ncbi:class V lanthionine synthetase subunit LxmK [Streptomyces sp. NPDC057099]|uniref:class V lanthionine synthetase subunit LxmK n=1 Tax=Streptomyces sp. NPDC057099 TaxID=3346019 RepID=UPI00363C0F52